MPDVLETEDAGGLEDDASEPRPPAGHAASAAPRVGPHIWWFGLVTVGLVAAGMTLFVYKRGLPAELTAIPHLDKALHFGVAGSLAFFLDGVLRRRALRVGTGSIPMAAVLLLVPAAIEEFLQRYSPHRSSSLADFAADVAGVAFFIWLSRRLER
ncbi:MAG: VanZ family protein [Labilithrix sp.]|nr:VanZ family protein [Labilithrix sp.]